MKQHRKYKYIQGRTYYQNPKVDYLFGFFGKEPIPTKQDKFVPIDVTAIYEDGTEEILKNIYVKKPDKDAVVAFNNRIKEIASKYFSSENIIKVPYNIEVIISISVTEKRYRDVDVDNLAKSVLDSLNNIAYEDDSQISSLICNKHIHPLKINAILIGITKLTEDKGGLGADIKLFGEEEWK